METMDLSASYSNVDERTSLLGISSNSQASFHSRHVSTSRAGSKESPEVKTSRWRSIRVMYLTMFLSSVSFSICMSSLYPYLRILDSKANTVFLGWVVASYSAGQLVASPFFGGWSNIRSRTREPITVSLVISVLANILYMYLESIQKNAQIYLLLSRALIGFGAGNVAVVRSYVAGATTISERTSAMATLSAFQALGFIFGNVLQVAMVPLGYPGPVHTPNLHIDMYSATGLFSALVGIMNIVILLVIFQEHTVFSDGRYKNIRHARESQSEPTAALEDQTVKSRSMSTDYIAVILSIMLFFSVVFIFAVFETIVTPLGMDMFAWKKAKAMLYVGIMLGCAGLVSIVVFVLIKIFAKIFNECNLLLSGFIICLLGYGFYLPWGNTYPAVQFVEIGKTVRTNKEITSHSEIKENQPLHKIIWNERNYKDEIGYATARENSTIFGKRNPSKGTIHDHIHSFTPNVSFNENSSENDEKILLNINGLSNRNIENELSIEAVGCPYYFDWCIYTPALHLWQYLLATLFIAVGYPTCSVMSYTIYSKVLGPKPQGLWMGWLTASGSLARALGPVFVAHVYGAYGPRVTFICVIGIILLSIIVLLVIYKRLVPFVAASQTIH